MFKVWFLRRRIVSKKIKIKGERKGREKKKR
jgi:hypothetical protein